ncbi:hypothetical protein CJ030_MR3G026385 [Morella rubra]|uniref:Uncharacterized protein n=1 Tax=Morella rubra TaxID=262757 RepID=A0A6A1W095_9ROSI|nr:hypothetical protein CJ030_MR3G026385 [Morella rubra]
MTTFLPRRESVATSTGNHVGRTSEHSSMKGPAIMTGWSPLLTRRRLKGGQECHCLCRRLIEMSRLRSISADTVYLVKNAFAFADDEYIVKDARFFVDELKTTERWSQIWINQMMTGRKSFANLCMPWAMGTTNFSYLVYICL